ncbi:putative tRNA pseudouridine synthase 1 [Porphyridium purpureum]|uniref:tRNA pseudouridine(55) synthase n=1 Tax=Porphyridium purpureum TaxID=35688 RepID=A0A5J4Z7I6_PORPP|nr:putative tRNA pseudouridine synthase 1 [Porphyridium purpureum]|eukprot:POR1197..scf295_1
MAGSWWPALPQAGAPFARLLRARILASWGHHYRRTLFVCGPNLKYIGNMTVHDFRKLRRAKALERKQQEEQLAHAIQEVRKSGIRKVPDCHFLILDKPKGEKGGIVLNTATRALSSVLYPALKFRHYALWLKYYKKKGSTLRLYQIGSLRKLNVRILDPLPAFASGVIVLGIERANTILEMFQGGTKEFEVEAEFGTSTNTYLQDGHVTETRKFDHVTEESVKQIVRERFTGNIMQVPPRDSHVMVLGKPICKHKYPEKILHLEARPGMVHSFEVTKVELPRVCFRIECDERLFVRKLIHDLAHALDTCAHVTELRRTRWGVFKVEDAIPATPEMLPDLDPKVLDYLKHANALIPGCFDVADPYPIDDMEEYFERKMKRGRGNRFKDADETDADSMDTNEHNGPAASEESGELHQKMESADQREPSVSDKEQ